MKYLTSLCVTLLSIVLIAGIASADIGVPKNLAVEASLSGGSKTNLFSDSSHQYCQFRGVSLDLDYSLFSFARFNLATEYTYYRQASNLSNLRYSAGATLLPFSDSSRFSLYLSGNMRDREYRDVATDSGAVNANEFTGREYDALFGVGYDLTQSIQLRASFSFASQRYGIDGVTDKETKDVALGSNITLFDRVSLDLELGGSTGKYQYIDSWYEPFEGFIDTLYLINPSTQYDILLIEELKSFYFSPRLSANLMKKTGLSLTYMTRNFQNHDQDHTVYGYSSGYLSPWNNTYEGQATVLRLKTYLIPRLIVSIDAGYWDKTYLRAVEYEYWMSGGFIPQPREGVNYRLRKDRSDYRSRTAITLKMPLTHSSGYFLEPTLTLDYTDNKSTVSVYNYTDFSVSGGLTVRF